MQHLLDKENRFRQEFGDLYAEIELKSLLNKIAEKIKHYVDCQETSIFLYNSKREELTFESATGAKQDQLKKIVLKKGEGIVGCVAETNRRLIINDCERDPRFSPKIDSETLFKTKSILGVPVNMDHKFLGVLEAINKNDGYFDDDDARLLEYIATFIAIPLQNAMFVRKLRDETREKDQLLELGKLISHAFNLEQVFEALKQIITGLIDPQEINVFVQSHNRTYRLMENRTDEFPQESDTRLETDTSIGRHRLIFPLRTQGKTKGMLEIKVGGRVAEEMLAVTRGIAVFAAISIEKFEMYTQMLEKEKIERELHIARDIQRSFLPSAKLNIQGLDIASINIPSSEVGGDYYDIVTLGSRETIFTINDVSGHGIPASLLMSIFRANFVYRIKQDRDMCSTIYHLNNLFTETTQDNHYVTSFTCKIDLENKHLEYLRAGHNPPIILRGDKIIELWDGSHPLGWFANREFKTTGLDIQKNDVIVLYTDGLIEVENRDGEQFSLQRVKDFFQINPDLDAEALKDKLITQLKIHAGESYFEDDVTFIIIKIL